MREFYKKMSQCRIFAVPITPGLERCAGDQSILNAMSFGKIVIATDSIATRLYIKNGINGFIVPESNPSKWRDMIDYIYSLDEKEYEKIGSQAEYSAKYVFSEKMRLYKTLYSVVDYFKNQYDLSQKAQKHISFDLVETPEETVPIPEKH
jgi:glycosyltransferase involved in cell wall biosynthesis